VRKFVPFKRFHLDWLGERAEPGEFIRFPDWLLEELETQNAWTGMIDGVVYVCCGTHTQWPGRHLAWAALRKDSGPRMGWITRECRKVLDRAAGRIELPVRTDFPEGLRWARLLGFHVETPLMKAFGPDGTDHVGFVRFN
jgi:hypothetical protein